MIGEQERKMGFAGAKATVGSLSGHGGRSNWLHTGIRPGLDRLPQLQGGRCTETGHRRAF
jgi:hypothetical protein